MKEIPISNYNSNALVDDEDYILAINHSKIWHVRFHAGKPSGVNTRSLLLYESDGRRRLKISLHCLVLNSFDNKNLDIDHKDRNPLNNQKSNLRVCEHHLNLHNNPKIYVEGIHTSKFKNVNFHRKSGKWMVQLSCKGISHYGGLFIDEIEAAKKANELMIKYTGEFALLNII